MRVEAHSLYCMIDIFAICTQYVHPTLPRNALRTTSDSRKSWKSYIDMSFETSEIDGRILVGDLAGDAVRHLRSRHVRPGMVIPTDLGVPGLSTLGKGAIHACVRENGLLKLVDWAAARS